MYPCPAAACLAWPHVHGVTHAPTPFATGSTTDVLAAAPAACQRSPGGLLEGVWCTLLPSHIPARCSGGPANQAWLRPDCVCANQRPSILPAAQAPLQQLQPRSTQRTSPCCGECVQDTTAGTASASCPGHVYHVVVRRASHISRAVFALPPHLPLRTDCAAQLAARLCIQTSKSDDAGRELVSPRPPRHCWLRLWTWSGLHNSVLCSTHVLTADGKQQHPGIIINLRGAL